MNNAKNLTTLSQLAKELGVNKSSFHYWTKEGLIKPEQKLSNVFVFDKKKTIKKLKELGKIK